MSEQPIIFKAGHQSAPGTEYTPYDYIMSSAIVDRVGDIVEQDWDLRAFRANPMALYGHEHSAPIGTWSKVRVVEDQLIGRLSMAEKGTSELIDMVRSLIDQRILRAVSVGFRPRNAEPLDEDNPWGGYRLSGNELLECSVVTVPANPQALSMVKTLRKDLQKFLLIDPLEHSRLSVADQLLIRTSQSAGETGVGASRNSGPIIQRARAAVLRAERTLRDQAR